MVSRLFRNLSHFYGTSPKAREWLCQHMPPGCQRELHSPFQALPLMQSTQRRIRIFVVEIDGSSHQQESSIGYINTFCHFLVQIGNDCIPTKSKGESLGVFHY